MQDVMEMRPEVAAQTAQAGALAVQQQGAIVGAAGALQPRQPSVIEAAIKAGASAAELREILSLQRDLDNHKLTLMREERAMREEDRKRAAELAFARDFAAFRGENIIIPKSKFVDRGRAGSFMQADYGTAAAMLSPALSRHGFSFRHDMKFSYQRRMVDGVENDVPWVYITCHLTHRDGHSDVLDLDGPPGDQSANTPVQNMQLTASYLKRQSLLAITGTATGGEDDEAAMRGRRQQPQHGEDGAQQGPDEALLEAGRAAAMNGMAALNKWWASLNPRQQKDMGPDFGPMRKAARQVDEGSR